MYSGKRLMDLALAFLAIIFLAPVYVGISIIVRILMGSPVLFRQVRPGLYGKPFILLKFRTMTDERDKNGKLLHDLDRITPTGKWLRRTSLDELPQLLNVIKGEMSIVGPRPLLEEYLELYTAEQARRHEVRPGITGWAQIHGRNETTWEDRFERDMWYVENSSFWLDCRIILHTVRSVIFSNTSVEQAHQLGRLRASPNPTGPEHMQPPVQQLMLERRTSMGNKSDREKATYWLDHYNKQHLQVGAEGVAKSLDYSNERVQFQTYAHILEGVGVLREKTVLDVGCGWGNLSIMLYGCGAAVTGIDIVPTTIRHLQEQYPFLSWMTVNLASRSDIDKLATFDCIVATEVLQHVDFQESVTALWTHVRPGGRLVASVPNSECPIVQRVATRYQGLWAPISSGQIRQIGEDLPDIERVLMRGLFFRQDQRFTPYSASDWDEVLQGKPNRIVFALLRST